MRSKRTPMRSSRERLRTCTARASYARKRAGSARVGTVSLARAACPPYDRRMALDLKTKLVVGSALVAATTVASLAESAPVSKPTASLASVHGEAACKTTKRMAVHALVSGGAGGGKGSVFVKSSRGLTSSAAFDVAPNQQGLVTIDVADASCSSPASFDIWLSTGGTHKGLVPETVTFGEGAPAPSLSGAGTGSVAGNAIGGG